MVTIEDDWAVFSFYRPDANQVFVAGDFNGWQTGDIQMRPEGDGDRKSTRLNSSHYS